jgi:thiol-disulfide isomerase/thioredoxin
MKRLSMLLVVAAISPIGARAQELNPPPNAPMYFAGLTAPNFTDTDEIGKNISLTNFGGYGGEFVVVDFAAVWCGPCNEEAQQGFVTAATAAVTDTYATQYLAYKGTSATVGVGSNIVQLLMDGPTPGTPATASNVLNWTQKYNLPFTVLYPSTVQDYHTAGDELYLYGNAFWSSALQSEFGGFFPLKVVIGPDMKIIGYPGSSPYDPNASLDQIEGQITPMIQNAFNTNDTYKLYDLIAFVQKSGVPISPTSHVYGSTVGHPLKDALGDLQDIQKADNLTTHLKESKSFCKHMATFVEGAQLGPASSVLLSTPLAEDTVVGKALDIQVDMGCLVSPFTFQPAAARQPGVATASLKK